MPNMHHTTEQVITFRNEKGELEGIIGLANDKDTIRNFVKFRVEKMSFDELAEELKGK